MFILATGFSAAVIYSQRRGDWVEDVQNELSRKLSGTAEIYLPGSNELEEASTRWSVLEQPKATVAIVPGTSNDVAEIVSLSILLIFFTSHVYFIVFPCVGKIRKQKGCPLPRVQWPTWRNHNAREDGLRHWDISGAVEQHRDRE